MSHTAIDEQISSRPNDEVAIRSVIERFWHGLDARDYEAFATCFTADAIVEYYDGAETVTGPAALVASARAGAQRLTATSHAVSHAHIVIDGDQATGDTFAVAHVFVGPLHAGTVLIRGVRYIDQFVRTVDGWRIHRRRHTPLWQYETRTVPPAMPVATDSGAAR